MKTPARTHSAYVGAADAVEELAGSAAGAVAHAATAVADRTAAVADRLAVATGSAAHRLAPAVESAAERVGPAVQAAAERIKPAMESAAERVGPAVHAAAESAGERLGPAVDKFAGSVASGAERLGRQARRRQRQAAAVADAVAARARGTGTAAAKPAVKPGGRHRVRKILLLALVAVGAAAVIKAIMAGRAPDADEYADPVVPVAPDSVSPGATSSVAKTEVVTENGAAPEAGPDSDDRAAGSSGSAGARSSDSEKES